MHRLRPTTRNRAVPLALIAAIASACALGAVPAGGKDRISSLQNSIQAKKNRESRLSGAAARLGRLERQTAHEIALLETRLAAVERELAAAQKILDSTQVRRDAAMARALHLRTRLDQSRATLAKLLRERYAGGRPDMLTVVLESDGFASLLETVDFLKRIQSSDQKVLAAVRDGRREAVVQRRILVRLTAQRQSAANAVRIRRNALASIADGLHQRRAALRQARSARLAALSGSRKSRLRAQRLLDKLIAQRNKANGRYGPGGPWAIPWAIVQCESGGQNMPPNWATASGYYQFIIPTWRGLGGSTAQAYQASKAEQDRLAAKLWDGGRGARNWDCASIVGII